MRKRKGLPAVMIRDARNDRLIRQEKAQAMAGHLAESLTRALPVPDMRGTK